MDVSRRQAHLIYCTKNFKGGTVARAVSILIMTIALITALLPARPAQAATNDKYASLVIDADTGMVLSERYADKVLHPASLTKMMTLMLMFEAIDRGEVKLNDRIRVSKHATQAVPSKLYLKEGSTIKVEDAIYALCTKSANDVAVAMAEFLGGTEWRFAQLMTSRARSIGMSNTRFRNAHGLHDPKQVTTARDMAVLARYILQRYPHHYKYFSTRNFSYKGNNYHNHNRLMSSYTGMDGFKTGYINASGFNLVASARRDGRRLIGVVFGGRTANTRNAHMKEILDAGFKKAETVQIAMATPPTPPRKPAFALASYETAPSPVSAAAQPGYATMAALSQSDANQNNTIHPNYTALTEALQKGRFGELVGEGDLDEAASKRLETGLLAVSMHRGDYRTPNPPPANDDRAGTDANNIQPAAMTQESAPSTVPPEWQSNQQPAAATGPAVPLPHPKDVVGKWAIQVGAFNSRVATDEALRMAVQKLPASEFKHIAPVSVPLRTADGMIFRARLAGMTQGEAFRACTYFSDCMPVAPRTVSVSAQK
jgi:D-alanyl-D-alanine carboxypeptidase